MKTLLVALALLVAAPVSAQTIHGAPDKAAYASPAEYPTDSAQCHWMPSDVGVSGMPGMTGHTHVDLTYPRYAEWSGTESFQAKFAVKLFHTSGRITNIDVHRMRDLVWDETGTSTPPLMVGDPMGLKVWTGHLTIDPSLDAVATKLTTHGWFNVEIDAVTYFTNSAGVIGAGSTGMRTRFLSSLYSTVDPSQPETLYPSIMSACNVGSATRVDYGTTLTEYREMMPLAPITAPWPIRAINQGYGAQNDIAPATFEERFDLDLHNGKPGTTIASGTGPGPAGMEQVVVLDPAILGPGTHKVAMMRFQPNSAGTEQLSSLLVVDVTVAGVTPPPVVLCSDSTATNVGQPLPCVFPPPPPPPALVFTVFTFTCDAAGKCQLVVK